MAGDSGPVLREPPGQLKGVVPVPGNKDEGDVIAATGGSLVPPGVSGAPRVGSPPLPKDFSKGFGS